MRATRICVGLLLFLWSVAVSAQTPTPAPAPAPGEDTTTEAPAAEPEAAPEPEVAPEPEAAPQPEAKPEPKPAPKAVPKPRPAEEAAPAPKAEPATDTLWSSLGGEVLPSGDDALRGWAGFPGVGVAFVTPLTRKFQLAPYFQFNYGAAAWGIEAPFLGLDLGAELKYQFYRKDGLSFAFVSDPGFRFYFDDRFKDDFAFGMRFGPRVEGTYAATRSLNVLFKGGLPFEMTFHPVFVFHLPLAFGGGVEFEVAKDVNLYFTSEIGPLFMFTEAVNSVDIWYRGEMGCEYRF